MDTVPPSYGSMEAPVVTNRGILELAGDSQDCGLWTDQAKCPPP